MRSFGLTPDQVLARDPSPDVARFPSLPASILHGAVGLGIVSVLAYSIWAFRLIRVEGAMFAATAVVYMGLGGLVLGRLVLGRGSTTRFPLLFALAFFLYAAAYCAFWFGLKGKYQADFWGSAVGLFAVTFLVCRAFEKREGLLLLFLGLLAFHSVGYYLGDYLHDSIRNAQGRRTRTGQLLWGAAHGAGLGAGLGFLLHHAQSALKLRLRAAHTTAQ